MTDERCNDPECPACILYNAMNEVMGMGCPPDVLIKMTVDVMNDVLDERGFEVNIKHVTVADLDVEEETLH